MFMQKKTTAITFTSENGTETVTTTALSWDGTYCPLTKGTTIRMNVASKTSGEYNHARIYVSRDKEPFVIKAEDAGNHDIALSYTIDF